MGHPNALVPIALVLFILAVGTSFATTQPRRAALWTLLGGWLFLPVFDGRYSFSVVHTKAAFVPGMVFLGSLLLDWPRWQRLRLRLVDIPAAVMCFGPIVTALYNGLGMNEALAAALEGIMTWGAPYMLGRAYLGSTRGTAELASAVVGATLVYAPLCLWEVRMSPQLHYTLYGFSYAGFDQVMRYGGYRPMLFMQHGLAVGMFMATGTLTSWWLWRSRARTEIRDFPLLWVCGLLAVTTLLCKSTGAILLLIAGVGVLEATLRIRTRALLLALALAPPAYCAARISGWDAGAVVALSQRIVEEDRASSLQFRIENEDQLIRRAMLKPWLGWGRFAGFLVTDEDGRIQSVVDGRWMIALGGTGLLGLIALWALLAIPPLLLIRRSRPWNWGEPRLAPAAALAVVVLLWVIDEVLNSMITPIYPLISGGLASFVVAAKSARVVRTHSAPVGSTGPRPVSNSAP